MVPKYQNYLLSTTYKISVLLTISFEKNTRTNFLVRPTVTAQIIRVEEEELTKIKFILSWFVTNMDTIFLMKPLQGIIM